MSSIGWSRSLSLGKVSLCPSVAVDNGELFPVVFAYAGSLSVPAASGHFDAVDLPDVSVGFSVMFSV